jgi:sensor c-di-GMP phosphodiesterase-like protein
VIRFEKSGSGQGIWKMKKIVAVTIVSAFLVFLSLYTVNAVIMGQQKSKLREISQTLLQYSEGLSQSVAQTLKGLTTQGCDKASLDRYRQIKLDSLYFADIGFIEQGKIICTAFWENSLTLSPCQQSSIKHPEDSCSRNFPEKIFSRAMRPSTIILLSSPPATLTINSPRLLTITHSAQPPKTLPEYFFQQPMR